MIPRLHVVTDDEVLARPDFVVSARDLLAVGGPSVALHLRGPGSGGALLHRHGRALLQSARDAGAHLFVNDRVDLALVLGVDGVQLGRRSLPLPVARRLLGEGPLLGASVHSVPEAADSERDGADFLFVGTLYPTPSHPGRPGAGPELLRDVAEGCRLPLIAIGGIVPARVPELFAAAPTHGVAVVRGVWGERAPADAVRRYLVALGEDDSGGS